MAAHLSCGNHAHDKLKNAIKMINTCITYQIFIYTTRFLISLIFLLSKCQLLKFDH